MVATLGVSYKSEAMLKVIEVLCLSLFFSLLLYGKVPFICNFSTEYNNIWYLLNVNNICDLLRMSQQKTKWVRYDMHSLNPSFIFY